ncbi:MAG: hypothetical protein WKF43_17605 [Acidimicrobiales bacterium]
MPHLDPGARAVHCAVLLVVLSLLVACSGGDETTAEGTASTSTATVSTTTAPPPPPPPELPGGGREIFPARRVVAYYGHPGAPVLGALGEAAPADIAARVRVAGAAFAEPGRPVLGAFELIASVAQASPGADGDYSEPSDAAVILPWLEAARANDMLLLLDVQPGRAPFTDEVKRYEDLLREPDVGLALDSEWRMAPDEVPGRTVGQVSAAEVNEVSAWLADIVREDDLPEKLFVLHQFTPDMIQDREAVLDRPGLATVVHLDGFGGGEVKRQKYAELHADAPLANGFKLFYKHDVGLLTPPEVLALVPSPDLITYQ